MTKHRLQAPDFRFVAGLSGQRVIADYDYIGSDRILERTYANGTRLTYLDDARQRDTGYDGIKWVVTLRHLRQDNTLRRFEVTAPPSDAAQPRSTSETDRPPT